jgi:hypothetical protein
MAFKEVLDLNPTTTTAIGGVNRQTGKKNPASIEGYYLGKKEVEDRKKKSGTSYLYVFQTAQGSVGVWGKTDLDRKMSSASPGVMMRVSFAGMQPTPNGEMYKYKVEVDSENTIDLGITESAGASEDDSTAYASGVEEDTSLEADEAPAYTAPIVDAATQAERAAKVKALLSKNKRG